MMRSLLDKAVQSGRLRQIDLYGAVFVESLAGGDAPELLIAAALASNAVGEGHICLPLAEAQAHPLFEPGQSVQIPDCPSWRNSLLASGMVGMPGGPEPLILDNADRLYLSRYHQYESLIAEDLRRRSMAEPAVDRAQAASLLDRLFGSGPEADWQKIAAAVAVLKQFAVISGGPGTGKTYTVARILALLQRLAGGRLRIGLAAPTGRAAVRLQESITQARATLDDALGAAVPVETRTLHRLLGYMPDSGRYRHGRDNQLHLDLLVIDEASMIDVPLMAGLVQALPEGAGLILLGDRDQLTSVEAGSLFGDICGAGGQRWSAPFCRRVAELTHVSVEPGEQEGSFGDSIVFLRTSYRFAEKSGIGRIASLVNAGDPERLTGNLPLDREDFVSVQPDPEMFTTWLAEKVCRGFEPCFSASGPEEALEALSRFRVLCAVREGKAGVAGINQLAESTLARHGLIRSTDQWYRGRPVMISRNHYALQLFNGDTGIAWPDTEGRLRAWFRRADGSLEPVALSRLPEHVTAYATTVHKAQGSEFDEVLLVLPPEDNRVISRELIYTAITRARKKLTLYGDRSLLAAGISRRVVRHSGLSDILWQVK